jgi:hypothetical protein
MTTSRLVPHRPFPAYAFVPGKHPHPESDPAGHSFGVKRPSAVALDPRRWQTNETYLYGLDLLNAGFYWEAHVEFESLWIAAGKRGSTADFLKGMIKLAAAGVKHGEGNADGVRSHARRAAELFLGVFENQGKAEKPIFGFLLSDLIALTDAIHQGGWPVNPPLLLPSGAS